MKLTTQQKISFGVLGLAAIAFVVDRCMSSSAPAAAHGALVSRAASTPVVRHAAPSISPVQASNPPDNAAATALSARLQQAADELNAQPACAQDAFTPSRSWGPVGSSGSAASERLAAAAQFRQKHTLKGCVINSVGGGAFLDGKFIRPGDRVDGFRLVDLTQRTALFDAGDIQVELTVVDAAQGTITSENMVFKPARGNSR